MKKVLYSIIFSFLFSAYIFPTPIMAQVPLNGDGEVKWNIKELSVKENEGIKLIVDKFRVFKITLKNNLNKEISIPLSTYFYGFSRNNLLKNNVLSNYNNVLNKTTIRKLIFYGPFWINLFVSSAIGIAWKNSEESNNKTAWVLAGIGSLFSLGAIASWSLLGWFFSIRHFNKTKKQYKMLDVCEPKIKLPRFMFKNVSPKMAGNQLIIPPKSELTDYLFVPISYPVNLDGAILSYNVN